MEIDLANLNKKEMKVHRDKQSTNQFSGNTYYECDVCSFDCGFLGSVSGNGLDTLRGCFIWIHNHALDGEDRDYPSVSILNIKLLVRWTILYAVSSSDIHLCREVGDIL
jgi:hypothetical protein